MNIRKLISSDYDEILVGWWKDWRWKNPPSRDILPDNGESGYIVYDRDTPVVAGFVYTSNSSLTYISWIVSNFRYKDRDGRREAMLTLLKGLGEYSRSTGAKYCYINFDNKFLIEVCESLGFIKGSVTQEMIKIWDHRQQA
jgi:hypothetical protein